MPASRNWSERNRGRRSRPAETKKPREEAGKERDAGRLRKTRRVRAAETERSCCGGGRNTKLKGFSCRQSIDPCGGMGVSTKRTAKPPARKEGNSLREEKPNQYGRGLQGKSPMDYAARHGRIDPYRFGLIHSRYAVRLIGPENRPQGDSGG